MILKVVLSATHLGRGPLPHQRKHMITFKTKEADKAQLLAEDPGSTRENLNPALWPTRFVRFLGQLLLKAVTLRLVGR